MQQEINLCLHISVSHIVVDMPTKGDRIDNFAAILNRYLQNQTLQQKFVIKLTIPGNDPEAERLSARFLEFKQLTGHSIYTSVLLVLGADLPDPNIIMRFFGEKVIGVQLGVNTFISNAKGYPVLPKSHQKLCKEFMKIQARFILEPRRNSDALDNYYNYLSHLFNAHDDFTEDTRANFSFRNYLQSPLQPLADNLEAATYETFENDTIKYERYEEACYMAFMDKLKYGRFKQTEGI